MGEEEKRMRRVLSIAMTLLLVFSFAAGIQARPASAQPATTGESVAITDAAGAPLIEVSIDSFTPDFSGYDRSYAPERGFMFAHITVTITNVGTSAYAPNAYGFVLIDTEGFINETAFAVIDETQAPAALDGSTIEPGSSVSGSVVFQMLAGTQAAAVAYAVTYDRFTFLALDADVPAIGETVEVLGPDAQPMANITVDEWLDPLPGVDSSSPPNRGHHFVGAVVTIENTGVSAIQTDPYSFRMLDSDGYEAGGSNPYRSEPEIADLPYTELAPGDTLSGLVGFQLFNSASTNYIAFRTSEQITLVAAFPDAPAIPQLSSLPEVTAPPAQAGDGAATNQDGSDVEGTPQASEECVAAEAWLTDFFDSLEESSISDFQFEDAADMTADELTAVQDEVEALLDELDQAEPPALAEGIFNSYIEILEYAVDALDDLIEAANNGEDLQPLVDEIVDSGAPRGSFDEAFQAYSEACPIVE